MMDSDTEKDHENPDIDDYPFDPNEYATHKTVGKGLLSISLMTSNANQLKYLVSQGSENNQFYIASFILIIASILLQTSIAIVAVISGKENINFECCQPNATKYNKALVIMSVLTIIVNVLITSFGKG